LATPLTYVAVNFFKKQEGIEAVSDVRLIPLISPDS
jgi:hypothetical protein